MTSALQFVLDAIVAARFTSNVLAGADVRWLTFAIFVDFASVGRPLVGRQTYAAATCDHSLSKRGPGLGKASVVSPIRGRMKFVDFGE